jgi:hypothetical protein
LYVADNPLNGIDPSGRFGSGYEMTWDLGSTSDFGSPEFVMSTFELNAASVFPFSLGKCSQITLHETCLLTPGPGISWPVTVTSMTSTSFTFTVGAGGFEPEGSTITFSTYVQNGDVYLRQKAVWNNKTWQNAVWTNCTEFGAFFTWQHQADNLRGIDRYAWWWYQFVEGKTPSGPMPLG